MTNKFGLPDDVLSEILDVLRRFSAIKCAKIFGSRAKGNYKRYSDVDIAIFADADCDLAASVKDALDDIDVIYSFDILHYERITNAEIKAHIDRVGVVILSEEGLDEKKGLVPEIRFRGFTGDWEERKLGEMMDFSNGVNAAKECYGKGRKMISVLDILSENDIKYNVIRNAVEVDTTTENNYRVENGDLVFVRSSEVVGEVGWAKAYLDDEYALFSGFSIRGKMKSKSHNKFIELSLNGKSRKQIESKAGGSTRYNVSQSILNDVAILLPTVPEQTAIGNFFRTLDNTITLHKRKLEGLKKLKKGYLQRLFPQAGESVPRMRFAGFSEPWVTYKLGELCVTTFGGGTPSTNNDDFWHGEISWLQSSDINEHDVINVSNRKYITTNGLENSAAKLIPAKSIAIVTRVGVGKICVVPFDYTTSQDFLSLSNLTINIWYGVYALYKMMQRVSNSVQGTSIKGITKDDLLNKTIEVPLSVVEQTTIGQFFRNLDGQITSQAQRLLQLKLLKTAYLQKMFI